MNEPTSPAERGRHPWPPIGRNLARLRTQADLTQEQLAERSGVSVDLIRRLEQGNRASARLDSLYRLACALGAPLAALFQQAPGGHHGAAVPPRLLPATWTPEQAAALLAGTGDTLSPQLATALAHEWLVADPPQTVEIRAGRQVGEGLAQQVEQRVQHLRRLDDVIGGGDLYALVAKELRATAHLLKEAAYTDAVGRRLLGVTADLCQLAGWVAADAGRHALAVRHYAEGLRAAHAAGSTALAANLVSSLGYLYANTGNLREAVLLARTAVLGAEARVPPTVACLLWERAAWAHACAGERGPAERALGAADRWFERAEGQEAPAWAYWLDRGELEVMAGRCWTELGIPRRARPLLEAALAGYDPARAREASLYASWLAACCLHAGDVDAAAAAAARAVVLGVRVRSARCQQRAAWLWAQLRPYQQVAAVREFGELYRSLRGVEGW